jgi:hypothetical protein
VNPTKGVEISTLSRVLARNAAMGPGVALPYVLASTLKVAEHRAMERTLGESNTARAFEYRQNQVVSFQRVQRRATIDDSSGLVVTVRANTAA